MRPCKGFGKVCDIARGRIEVLPLIDEGMDGNTGSRILKDESQLKLRKYLIST
jgi:hypothetical protein